LQRKLAALGRFRSSGSPDRKEAIMNRRHLLTATAALGMAAVGSACAPVGGSDDIVAVASGNEDFSTLVAAVSAAGLVETLQGPGPFTVFAPTNDAFAALPAGTVDTLLLPQNREQLAGILAYHVVPGRITAAQLAGQRGTLTTVQGETIQVDATGAGVTVNGVNVVAVDVAASNGVIHVIDGVLLP
jgi:uncharacterized surface protein with fasciclin (FAS1) repeats